MHKKILILVCVAGCHTPPNGAKSSGGSSGGGGGASSGVASSGGSTGGSTACIDNDGDGFGAGCARGPDCDDANPNLWASCATCIDNDHDGYGVTCDLGDDCDDTNPFVWASCDTCADADGDGHFAGCDAYANNAQPDCNDGDNTAWQLVTLFTDDDQDGFTVEDPSAGVPTCIGDQTIPFCLPTVPQICYASTSLGVDCNDEAHSTQNVCAGSLLKNIDSAATEASSSPHNFVAMGDIVIFSAQDARNGDELWRSDAGVPSLVKDINPGPADSGPVGTISNVSGSKVYFAAFTQEFGGELWESDGTAQGTTLLKDINPGPGGSGISHLVATNNGIYFQANDGVHGNEVWHSDGTNAGTVMVKDICAGSCDGAKSGFVAYNGEVMFRGQTTAGDNTTVQMWIANGAAATKVSVTLGKNANTSLFLHTGSHFFYTLAPNTVPAAEAGFIPDDVLRSYNDTDGNTTVLALDKTFSGNTSDYQDFTPMFAANADLYYGLNHYHGSTTTTDFELHQATHANDTIVDDVIGPELGACTHVGNCDTVTAGADIAAIGDSLAYVIDGTGDGDGWTLLRWLDASGTPKTLQEWNLHDSSEPGEITAAGSTGYFRLDTGGIYALYSATSAGVTALSSPGCPSVEIRGTVGTSLLFDSFVSGGLGLCASKNGSAPVTLGTFTARPEIGLLNSGAPQVYFNAQDASDTSTNVEPWWTDGTVKNTNQLGNLARQRDSSPSDFTIFNARVFFAATEGTDGTELWSSDGTTTALYADLNAGSNSSSPGDLTVFNSALYFTADNGSDGAEFWKTDGISAPTEVANIQAGGTGSQPGGYTVFDGDLIFSATGTGSDTEYYTSSGSGAPTQCELNPSLSSGSLPGGFFSLDATHLLFSANDGANGQELWLATDTTCANTKLLKDINPGSVASNPGGFLLDAAHSRAYFTATTAALGNELWQTDGTSGGTINESDIHSGTTGSNPSGLTLLAGLVYFAADDGTHGVELWSHDTNTDANVLVMDINQTGSDSSNPSNLIVANGNLFFTADDGVHGREVWSLTPGGTPALLKDIWTTPLGEGSNPSGLTPVAGGFVFAAADRVHGVELWRSDGTAAGTVMVQDLASGASSSNPSGFFVDDAEGLVYFSADDAIHGVEPWIINISDLAL